MRALVSVPVALGLVTAVVGCILVTGGTSGYATADAGAGGVQIGDACTCSMGQVCCLPGLDAALPLPACQTSCSQPWQQLCNVASDCGDAASAACLIQACTIEEASVQLQSCGPIPICVQ
jgi:hypothetical protein